MYKFSRDAARFLRDESGQDIVEYALVACVIGLGAVAAMQSLSNGVKSVFTAVGTTITTAI